MVLYKSRSKKERFLYYMISFIVCDDNETDQKRLNKRINEFMKGHKEIEYKISTFVGYDSTFYNKVKEFESFKVYFLDIETKKGSGIDAVRKIREYYSDWNSIIIIQTAHNEHRYTAQNSRLIIMDFIDKNKNYNELIDDDLNRIFKIYYKSLKAYKVEYHNKIELRELREILYIEKELAKKYCLVHTLNGTKKIPKSINILEEELPSDFIKVSRSSIINIKKIHSYDVKNNIITFKNGETTDLISREYKRKLKEHVKNYN